MASVIKFNYGGVSTVKTQLDQTLTEIEDTGKEILSHKNAIMESWQAQEAVEFYNHVDNFVKLLSDFKTKYEAYTTFLQNAVSHYESESDILCATIEAIGAGE